MEDFCAIISGGAFSPLENIEKAAFIIACDQGLAYAQRCKVKPDLLVGDFDSYQGKIPDGVPRLELPAEKDDTDTMAAVRCAVDEGWKRIALYCAFGGRLDHLLGNLQAAAFAVKNGAAVEIIDEDNRAQLFSNASVVIPERPGYSLTLLALSDTCRNVTAEGVKYPLAGETLTNAFPIGVSNEWRGDARVSVGEGVLMVLLSKMK